MASQGYGSAPSRNSVEAGKVSVSASGSGKAFGRGDDTGNGPIAGPAIKGFGGSAGGVALSKSLGQTGQTGKTGNTYADGGLIPGKIA